MCERKLTPGVGLRDVSIPSAPAGMTSRFSLLEKQNGNNEVPLFLRVDRMYYLFSVSSAFVLRFIQILL